MPTRHTATRGTTIVRAALSTNEAVYAEISVSVYGGDIAQATIEPLDDRNYTSEVIDPSLEKTHMRRTLEKNVDFTAEYTNNVDVGTATVTVEGKGGYYGSQEFSFTIAPLSLSDASLALGTTKAGTDYAVAYTRNKNAGTATVRLTGKGNYKGTVTKTFTIAKAAQPLKVKAANKTARYALVKKANRTLARPLKVTMAKGAVTYKKVAGNAKLSVNAKTGKVTVAKGLKKGKYSLKIRVTAKGTANFKSGYRTVATVISVK